MSEDFSYNVRFKHASIEVVQLAKEINDKLHTKFTYTPMDPSSLSFSCQPVSTILNDKINDEIESLINQSNVGKLVFIDNPDGVNIVKSMIRLFDDCDVSIGKQDRYNGLYLLESNNLGPDLDGFYELAAHGAKDNYGSDFTQIFTRFLDSIGCKEMESLGESIFWSVKCSNLGGELIIDETYDYD